MDMDLALEDVSRTYGGPVEVAALRPTTLIIERGSFTAVTGPSGSGKSTLLNVLGMLDVPTSGRYLVGGVDAVALGELERTTLRARVFGFVFQAFHLLATRTAAENVELGMLYKGMAFARRQAGARTCSTGWGCPLGPWPFPGSFREENVSVWLSPGLLPGSRRCCCVTSPLATSTVPARRGSWRSSRSCTVRG